MGCCARDYYFITEESKNFKMVLVNFVRDYSFFFFFVRVGWGEGAWCGVGVGVLLQRHYVPENVTQKLLGAVLWLRRKSRWPLTSETQVESQASPCGICGGVVVLG
jgi:hypothetical protein